MDERCQHPRNLFEKNTITNLSPRMVEICRTIIQSVQYLVSFFNLSLFFRKRQKNNNDENNNGDDRRIINKNK